MTLTAADRHAIDMARQLVSANDPDAVRKVTGTKSADLTMVYAEAFGAAQVWLRELADLAGRLEADASRLRNDRARYRTRLVLPPDDDDRKALREAGQPGRLAAEETSKPQTCQTCGHAIDGRSPHPPECASCPEGYCEAKP